ncbi:MAG: Glycosyl hydrolases family 2, sugar binding domain [Firmicutes bacterium ADurb.Bin193]|nr:MAG: Glycosyl hydrolases family 2, sugar binding domain [Firmicutes bacterium ADurb.Bin193]
MIKKEMFKDPPSVYRSAPFWSLNGKLEQGELRRQLREFKKQGMGGAFLHPRLGMITEYLSGDYFDAIGHCIDECEAQDMKAWLYDEDQYPSGNAGGRVVGENKDFGQRLIVSKICDAADSISTDDLLAMFLLKDNSYERIVSNIPPKSGKLFCLYTVFAPNSARFNNNPHVDICNKDAIDSFIKITHDKYYERFKSSFGKSIPAIFTDEPSFTPRHEHSLPWTPALPERFIKKNNYDLIDRLPELFFNMGDYVKTRFDYWDLLLSMSVEAYSKNIYDWCCEKGIAFTGHYWEHRFPMPIHTASVMPHYEYMQIPGIDMLYVNNPGGVQYGNDFIVKEASSVANQMGHERVLSETYGGSGWSLNFADQKKVVDWQLALGINLFCQHLSHYTLTGYRKRDYPLSFLDHQPWWKNYRLVGDYIGRMSYALSQGKYCADVLVLHPSSSTWTAFTPYEPLDKLEAVGNSVKELVKNLDRLQITFDLGDDVIISKHAHVSGKILTVGRMDYSVVIIPQTEVIRGRVLELLKEFSANGGVIITTGNTPTLLDGVFSQEVCDFFSGKAIIKVENTKSALDTALKDIPITRVRLSEKENKDLSDIYVHVRAQESIKTVFICNLNPNQSVNLSMPIEKPCFVERLNAETGESTACEIIKDGNGYCISFGLSELGSVLFMLNEDQEARLGREEAAPAADKTVSLSDWSVRLLDKNALNLQFCRASLNGAPYEEINDVLAVEDSFKERLGFGGNIFFIRQPYMYPQEEREKTAKVKIEYPFTVHELPEGEIMLASERPDVFSVYINNQKVEPTGDFYKDRAFALYDIKPYVEKGENTVRLETDKYGILVNLESVYIVGDFSLAKNGKSFSIQKPKSLKPGNIADQGCPYYSGLINYTAEFDIRDDFSMAKFSFERFDGVTAEVFVNGRPVRTIGWKPYSADITPYLKKGKNVIEIEIANSLQNLLGPFDATANLNLTGPNAFYAKEHTRFVPAGFYGKAVLQLWKK